jgi:hypothetical protein
VSAIATSMTGVAEEPLTEAACTFADPVFVLCNGRSGSTLLRFLLDAHPELACPPETNLPGLCVQLATVWSLIEGAPLSANRGDEPPEIPEAAIAGVRETMDRMVGSYLARRRKKRYCDKSLGTARYAELLRRVYPEARFICMYRHPMDVIASGMEACPWGLNGYGFDPYIAATPGNAVMALANFWTDNVRVTLAVEERFSGVCFRLRYEDLVADPEGTAAALFDFLGVAVVPDISRACFSAERERFGPADYKIWYTSHISGESVGRGWSVPTGMIAPQLLGVMNELAGQLGYLAVDDAWGTTAPPVDLRVPVTAPNGEADGENADGWPTSSQGGPQDSDDGSRDAEEDIPEFTAGAAGAAPVSSSSDGSPRSRRLAEALRTGLAVVRENGSIAMSNGPPGLAPSDPEPGEETFVAVVVTRNAGHSAEYWRVDLAAATVTQAGPEAQEDSHWDVIGAADAWDRVLDGQVNLSVALRSCQLRYCDNGEAAPLVADTRIATLARLLGLATWQ